ncbi:MAG: riboflavin synthase [Candidatus Eisenbacteria bacterium]
MFTGLVEAKGRIVRVKRTGGARRLRIAAPFVGELSRGESVSVSGVCLTVASVLADGFEAEAVERTLATTTLGEACSGDSVNLERALRVGDRLGGHMVTGHVDGVAVVERVTPTSNGRDVTLTVPPELTRYLAARGSVALDGVSLTVAVVEGARVTVSLIPETLSATTAGALAAGSRVNVETDIVAKYQESLGRGGSGSGRAPISGSGPTAARDPRGGEGGLTLERLRELGFTK